MEKVIIMSDLISKGKDWFYSEAVKEHFLKPKKITQRNNYLKIIKTITS